MMIVINFVSYMYLQKKKICLLTRVWNNNLQHEGLYSQSLLSSTRISSFLYPYISRRSLHFNLLSSDSI